MITKFSFHDKRVTLQLARLSTAADENQALADVLSKLPDLGFDVYRLDQEAQEILFAEFDGEMEERIKSEFEADGTFLIDLGHSMGVCPLCGHIGCRYIFRVANKVNGKTIECGSECIITHGLCVKGSETADHARKALETTIRRHIRKLKIEEWHTNTGFSAPMFETLASGLWAVSRTTELPYQVRHSARCKVVRDLPKLLKFYERNGWLNTEKRWAEWTRLVSFARKFNPNTKHSMNHPIPFGAKPLTLVSAVNSFFQMKAATEEADAQDADLVQQASDESKTLSQPKVDASPIQIEFPFEAMTKELVFG